MKRKPKALVCAWCEKKFSQRFPMQGIGGPAYCSRACVLAKGRAARGKSFEAAVRRGKGTAVSPVEALAELVVGALPLKPPGHREWCVK